MTAIVIDRMRSASFGAQASRSSSLNYADAKLVERACARLTYRSRTVLRMHYVWNAAPGAICRKLDMPIWPSSHFNRALVEAKAEIEKIVDNAQD
jgi:DNA-directed RNA polymerase specialized sigma24 family protein